MSNQSSPILYEVADGVARIRFNRPEVMNAFDQQMADEFVSICRQIAADASVRAVVLSGEGRAFVAGGDLNQLRQGRVAELIAPLHESIEILTALPVPVLASLHGAVAGAGLSLALACDLAIAAEGTKFNLAYRNVGVSGDLAASWSLPRVVGIRKAMEIAMLSDTLDVAEAARLGIVNRVVPAAELAGETEKLIQRLATGPTVALGEMKRLIRTSFSRDIKDQLDAETVAFLRCSKTADFTESIDAFFAKRPPQLQGK